MQKKSIGLVPVYRKLMMMIYKSISHLKMIITGNGFHQCQSQTGGALFLRTLIKALENGVPV